MEIKLYPEEPFEDSLIITTFQDIYHREFDISYWKWRYFNNPYEKEPNIAYIKADGKLACFYAVSETLFINDGKLIRCGLMNSAMTHPDFAGKGLFSSLEQVLHKKLLEEKGLEFVFGFANHNAHRIHRKYARWKDLFVLNNFYANSGDILKRSKLSSSFIFENVSSNYPDLNIISSLSYSDSGFSFYRNESYIKWRIIDNPVNKYFFLKIFNEASIQGLLIFKEYQGSIDIMEFFYNNADNKSEVLKQGLTWLAGQCKGIYIWSNLFSEEHIFLESLSFQEKEFNTYFGFVSNGFDLNKERLHFRFIDSDVY